MVLKNQWPKKLLRNRFKKKTISCNISKVLFIAAQPFISSEEKSQINIYWLSVLFIYDGIAMKTTLKFMFIVLVKYRKP